MHEGRHPFEIAAFSLAVVALLSFGARVYLANDVGKSRALAAEQQQRIASANVLGQVNNRLIQMLASSAATTGDTQISTLLARNGVQFSISPNEGGTSGGPQTQGAAQ
ncbi:hypothetical protein [Sandaracinobacteroides hominis]|uniref:hypothetical protein n=1 Tax=Sandaracinobacteroides hominis TaxID=2780086 RepID=UPI0018F4CAD5|nr:hypothetical protein [Sandaracinobacteroides hominis]